MTRRLVKIDDLVIGEVTTLAPPKRGFILSVPGVYWYANIPRRCHGGSPVGWFKARYQANAAALEIHRLINEGKMPK